MIQSPATLWRDTKMAYFRGYGMQFKDIGPLFRIGGGRVSQCLEKRQRNRRFASLKLAEFKASQCYAEIRILKRAYDRMSDEEKAANKSEMAAQMDMLLGHYREVIARVGA